MQNQSCELLDGATLTPQRLIKLANDNQIKIDLTVESWQRVSKSRAIIEEMVKSCDKVVYGVNTGFGNFANKVIAKNDLRVLQLNLIRSHSVGVGSPLKPQQVRMLQILRINTLAKGRSGISTKNLKRYIDAFNHGFIPRIPSKGTVGASGDLAPLAHLALGMIGEGLAWDNHKGQFVQAAVLMKKLNLQPIQLEQKQGLALINGTQFMSSLACQALSISKKLVKLNKVLICFIFQVFGLDKSIFNAAYINRINNHHMKELLSQLSQRLKEPSQMHKSRADIFKNHSYSLQHSINNLATALQNIQNIQRILTEEINGATDNPLIYSVEDGFKEGVLLSAGNFHGEYVAKSADMLAIAMHSLGKFSERRIENYVNGHISHLPQFLCAKGQQGLNSGFMIVQCTSAALMSENKCLVKPASVDSIPTSANQEDHVSMGGYACRKLLQLLENLFDLLAIEFLIGCQAIDIIDLKPCSYVRQIHQRVRQRIPFVDKDLYLGSLIDKNLSLLKNNAYCLWDN